MTVNSYPCVELIKIVVNEAYTQDPGVSRPGIDAVARAPGCLGTYIGNEKQDPQNLFLINTWNTLQCREDFIANLHQFASQEDGLTLVMRRLTYLIHVYFSTDTKDALSAPLTEVTMFQVHRTYDTQDFAQILARLVESINSLPPGLGRRGSATWGIAVENSKQFVVLCGWDDLKSWEDIRSLPGSEELFAELGKHATFNSKHVALSRMVGF